MTSETPEATEPEAARPATGQSDGAKPLLDRYRYVFVVTYGRSGSTLLQSVLNSTPGTQIRGENGNVLYFLYRSLSCANQAIRSRAKDPAPRLPDHPWFGFNEIKARRFDATLLNAFVRDVLVPDPAAQVIGFKEIRYTSLSIAKGDFAPYMDFLLNRFPQARIVFNSRRADDVLVSSFMAVGQPDQTRLVLREADQMFADYDRSSDRTIHMHYEDYVADHGLIHKMLDFLELAWSADRVAAVMKKRLVHASRPSNATD